jgi:hypothetical protein
MASNEPVHYSERQRAEVGDRGAGFGDIHLFDEHGHVQARFLWTRSTGVSVAGDFALPAHYKLRAVRALAETTYGLEALGLPADFSTDAFPDADDAERQYLEDRARVRGVELTSLAPSPATSGPVVTTAVIDGLEVEVTVRRR